MKHYDSEIISTYWIIMSHCFLIMEHYSLDSSIKRYIFTKLIFNISIHFLYNKRRAKIPFQTENIFIYYDTWYLTCVKWKVKVHIIILNAQFSLLTFCGKHAEKTKKKKQGFAYKPYRFPGSYITRMLYYLSSKWFRSFIRVRYLN